MQGGKQLMRKYLALLLAMAMVFTGASMNHLTARAEGEDPAVSENAVNGGSEITAGGEYELAAGAAGVITINTTDPITLVGKGSEEVYSGLFVKAETAGVQLTIRDLYIEDTVADASMFDFIGQGNTFTYDGTSVLDFNISAVAGKAAVHVGADTELVISGADADDSLYMYKSEQGAGIGGNQEEPNGAITFEQGNLFIKGTKQGAVIGSGANSGTAVAGDISINGGTINLICNARGAGIGGSAGSGGAAAGTTVRMNGGLLNINVDWTGAGIGGGGFDAGNDSDGGQLIYKAGSVRVFIDSNAAGRWEGAEGPGVNGNLAVKADVLNEDGEELALLELDTDLLADAEAYTVKEGENVLYSGGLHKYAYINEDTTKEEGQQPVTTTPSNWTETLDDSNLYLYATKEAHTYDVNGETVKISWDDEAGFSMEVEEPVDPAAEYDWDSPVWAGGLDFSWFDAQDVQSEYHLTTPAQWEALAWICSEDLAKLAGYKENTAENVKAIRGTVPTEQFTFPGVQFYLDNDIDMGGVCAEDGTWSGPNYYPIGSQAQNDTKDGQFYGLFYGSFDGQGHFVNNIFCDRGTDQSSQSCGLFGRVGAADGQPAPENDITIQNVGVSGYIHSGRSVGGIVGKTLHVASGYVVTIQNCANKATVRSNQKKGVGGICGAFWNGAVMKNCYSTGTAGGGTPLGSIVGGNEGTIENVYSTQSVAVAGENATANASVTNGYALGIDISEEEMKTGAFAKLLGDGFKANCGSTPVLAWEEAKDHTAGEAAYEWAEDYSTVTAAISCSECGDVILTETVNTSSEVTKRPTASETGIRTYTAAFEAEAFAAQTMEEVIPVLTEAEAEARETAADTLTRTLIDAYASVKEADYTAESYAVFKEKVDAAEKLLEQEDSYTSELRKANSELLKAWKNLEKKPVKLANTMTAKGLTKTVKYTKVKKAKQTVTAITVKNAKGTVSYKKSGGSGKLTVSAKTGKVTVKKGTKKGTYKIKVKVTAAGNATYKKLTKTVTVTVKVK